MEKSANQISPKRVTDLVELKKKGAEVTCETEFEILPVDFAHRNHQYQAHIFLCRYSGAVDGRQFSFRKCYSRGCPNNLCPHVSQAVMIANRFLHQDYRRLAQSGIKLEEKLFTLEDMVVKYENLHEQYGSLLSIHDYINIAREGTGVVIDVDLEYVPGVEHFANYENAQIFLMADFSISCLGKTHHNERCFACYAAEKEKEEKQSMIEVANERLRLLYQEFDQAAIKCEKRFFE